MRIAVLEDALKNAPFVPFDVHVDGGTIRVGQPEQVILTKSKTTAVIVPNDHVHVVDIDHISSLTLRKRKKGL